MCETLRTMSKPTIAEIDGVWTAWPAGTEPALDGPTASMYWFAALTAYPEIVLG